MKKFIAIVAVAVSLTACNSGASTEATTPVADTCKATDTCKVACDSTKAVEAVKEAK
jgi:hypothetical protein